MYVCIYITIKVTVMQIEKALINDHLPVSKVFNCSTIYNFGVMHPWKLLFF